MPEYDHPIQPNRQVLRDCSRNTSRRALIACTRCRQRKIKCDGKTTCSLCAGHGIKCIYEKVSSEENAIIAERKRKRKETKVNKDTTSNAEQYNVYFLGSGPSSLASPEPVTANLQHDLNVDKSCVKHVPQHVNINLEPFFPPVPARIVSPAASERGNSRFDPLRRLPPPIDINAAQNVLASQGMLTPINIPDPIGDSLVVYEDRPGFSRSPMPAVGVNRTSRRSWKEIAEKVNSKAQLRSNCFNSAAALTMITPPLTTLSSASLPNASSSSSSSLWGPTHVANTSPPQRFQSHETWRIDDWVASQLEHYKGLPSGPLGLPSERPYTFPPKVQDHRFGCRDERIGNIWVNHHNVTSTSSASPSFSFSPAEIGLSDCTASTYISPSVEDLGNFAKGVLPRRRTGEAYISELY